MRESLLRAQLKGIELGRVQICLPLFNVFLVLGIELGALHILSNCSDTSLCPQALCWTSAASPECHTALPPPDLCSIASGQRFQEDGLLVQKKRIYKSPCPTD